MSTRTGYWPYAARSAAEAVAEAERRRVAKRDGVVDVALAVKQLELFRGVLSDIANGLYQGRGVAQSQQVAARDALEDAAEELSDVVAECPCCKVIREFGR